MNDNYKIDSRNNQMKTVRRFPENNNHKPDLMPKPTFNIPQDSSYASDETDINHNINHSNHSLTENQRRIHTNLPKSNKEHRMDRNDGSSVHQTMEHGQSGKYDGESFNNLINCVDQSNTSSRKVTRLSTKSIGGKLSVSSCGSNYDKALSSSSNASSKSTLVDNCDNLSTKLSTPSPQPPLAPTVTLLEVIDKGKYLQEFSAWHEFRGASEIKNISRKMLERNNNIWELVSHEYTYLVQLDKLNEVYGKSYPYMDAGSSTTSALCSSTQSNPSSARSSIIPGTRADTDLSSAPNSFNNSHPSGSYNSSLRQHHNNNFFESIESILPGLEPLIETHCKVTNYLIDNQLIRPDRVITDIGKVLNEAFTEDICKKMAELYGIVSFTKQYIDQKLNIFKKFPQFSSYLHKCERDPRFSKKIVSIPDWLLMISTHWFRTITTLNSLINNTINDSQEVTYLNKCKDKIDSMINESTKIMETFQNRRELQTIIDNFDVQQGVEISELAYERLTADNAALLHFGELKYQKTLNNGKFVLKDILGIALESCMFFVTAISEAGKNSVRYQIFFDKDFPSFLDWGTIYGYFREGEGRSNGEYGFYLIIDRTNPNLSMLVVNRQSERQIWKNIILKGFSCWQSETLLNKNAQNELEENMRRVDQKNFNTSVGLDLIKSLDRNVITQMQYRTVGFECVLEEELKKISAANAITQSNLSMANSSDTGDLTPVSSNNNFKGGLNSTSSSARTVIEQNNNSTPTSTTGNSPTSTGALTSPPQSPPSAGRIDTYIPDLSTREGMNDWLEVFVEWVNRLKFAVFSTGSNITRSASEIDSRKRPSVTSVKKYETFSTRDSTSYGDKKSLETNILNQSINKKRNATVNQKDSQSSSQHNQQRRVSVSSITNFFRMNSRNSKHDNSPNDSSPSRPRFNTADSSTTLNEIGSFLPTNDDAANCELLATALAGQSEQDAGCIISPLSSDILIAFNELNKAARNVTTKLLEIDTRNLELESELKSLREQNDLYKDYVRKIKVIHGIGSSDGTSSNSGPNSGSQSNLGSFFGAGPTTPGYNSLNTPGFAGGIGGSSNDVSSIDNVAEYLDNLSNDSLPQQKHQQDQKATDYKRQMEHLRYLNEQFNDMKTKWTKEYEQKKNQYECKAANLEEKTKQLEAAQEDLNRREKDLDDKCKLLQNKIDLYHQQYKIKLNENVTHEEITAAATLAAQNNNLAPHSRSQSDDATKRMSTSPVPRQSNHHTSQSGSSSFLIGKDGAASLSTSNYAPDLPDHLRESLINTVTGASPHMMHHTSSSSSGASSILPRTTPQTPRKYGQQRLTSNQIYDESHGQLANHSDIEDNSIGLANQSSSLVSLRNNSTTSSSTQLKMPLDLAQKTKVKKDKKILTFIRKT